MGCASSKQVDAGTVAVYRPAPTSFAVFDIDSIKEPWLQIEEQHETEAEKDHEHEKPIAPILEKLEKHEDSAPRSWDEVSKELEDLKPTLNKQPQPPPPLSPVSSTNGTPLVPVKKVKRRSFSFHTIEELENNNSKVASKQKPSGLKKTESFNELKKPGSRLNRMDTGPGSKSQTGSNNIVYDGYKSLMDNPFLQRDKEEREKQGLPPLFMKRDPLEDYPEICPRGGSEKVVIYSTSLGGIRRTKEDCNRVRSIMELHGFLYEERDISLHSEFRTELKGLLGDSVSVPRMFVKGRYIGGVDEIVGLNETGRLRRILSRVGIEREVGRQACEGCGGARFVPCLECGGSCKIVVDGKKDKERCPECNENGLMYCPMCS